MASELTTTTSHPTAVPATAVGIGWLRELLPFRAVVLPWLVARLVVVPALALADGPGGMSVSRLLWMDGQWFRLIAVDWYDRPYTDGAWSEYPFFPLFPAAGGALMQLGFPPTAALAGISWLAALAAMAGAYRLACRHLPATAAPWAPWFLAIAPGALTMVMAYADSLFVAGAIWAFVLAEDRRWWAAGLVALVATASRPNGFIVVVSVVVAVLLAKAGARAVVAVVVPSLVFLLGWCWYLWWATDDPLVFWSAKEAWDELSLSTVLTDPLTTRNRAATFHLLAMGALLVPYIMRVRRQPPAWACFTALGLLPPFVLGVEGLARYAVMAFPLPFAAADVLAGRRRWPAVVFLIASGVAMVVLAVLVVRQSWVP